MKIFIKVFYIPLLFLIFSTSLLAWEDIDGGRGDFTTDSTFHLLYGGRGNTVLGDFNATGNSILASDNPNNANLINDTTTFKVSDTAFNNNTYSLGDSEKMNSSSAQITLPSYVKGSDIVWAGLFWQGHIYRPDGVYDDSSVDADAAGWNKVTIKDSTGTMHQLEAPIGDDNLIHKAFHHTITSGEGYRHHYGAYCEVTNIIKKSYSSIQNTFTVGNIKTTAGQDTGGFVYISQAPEYSGNYRFGLYGGWSLIVVYSVDGSTAIANSVPPKTVSIYDGYDLYLTWGDDGTAFETTIDISGFYTPRSGVLNSKLLLFGGAGDKGISDDTLQIQDQNNVGTYIDLSNSPNPIEEQFNHTYTIFGNHLTPGDTNKQGMDLDIFNVSNQMTNGQSETKIKFGVVKNDSHCDQIFPQVIAFSTELYEPKFCYDYAYEQYGRAFTEDNNGSFYPRLTGNVATGEPIETTIYIRNLVDSDIVVTDMFVNILDINTTQAVYLANSTKLAKDVTLPVAISDSNLNVSDAYVKEIEIGTIATNDYFYTYYSLDPQRTALDMPINVEINYNITIGNTTIPYTSVLGSQVEMCTDYGFTYTPTVGIFNVVHNNYYDFDIGGSNRYYNLPTQVTSREGNFKVLVLDPSDYDTPLNNHNVIFAEVEIIDAAAFHDTDASCYERDSSISASLPVMFDSNMTSVSFNNSVTDANFYQNARENAAFRVSYFTRDSNDSTLPDYTKDGNNGNSVDTYTANWTMNWTGDTCVMDMDSALDSNGNMTPMTTDDKVMNWCQTGGSGMTAEQALACLKCVYGDKRNYVCSRDNFAIRPEAFLINLKDQNQDQNLSTQILSLTTGFSGSVGAIAPALDLATGYNYIIEVNATDYIGNNSTAGYTRMFSKTLLVPNDFAQYTWNPSQGTTVSGCNDDSNITTAIKFVNGKVDANSSLSQVGEYQFTIQDSLWTSVDNNPLFMDHHSGNYFLDKTVPDCALSSSTVFPVNTIIDFSDPITRANSLTGCNISSNHTTPITNIRYNNINVVSHPYQLNMAGITPSVGLNNTPINPNSFVYMSDMNVPQDYNMSFHLNGTISAVGFDNGALSNFVDNCYAEPVSLTLAKTDANDTLIDYRYRYYNSDIPANDQNGSLNTATDMITLQASDFNGSNGGRINIRLNLNFDRSITLRNPESITYSTFDSNASSTFNADLTTTNLRGSRDLNNSSIAHYYGRTHAARQRYAGNQGVANIYYEVYCFDTINTNTCNKTLLQDGLDSNRTNDLRWYINSQHNPLNDGNISNVPVRERSGNTFVTENFALRVVNSRTEVTLNYNGNQGFPYKTTMENNASTWLIYNENTPGAIRNEFSVEFEQIGGSWSGQHETSTTTNDTNVIRTNRRSMW